jgi:hypothetical protein
MVRGRLYLAELAPSGKATPVPRVARGDVCLRDGAPCAVKKSRSGVDAQTIAALEEYGVERS